MEMDTESQVLVLQLWKNKMKKNVLIIGNSTTAEVLLSYILKDYNYNVLACVVDDGYENYGKIKNIPTYNLSKAFQEFNTHSVTCIMAMGYDNNNFYRENLFYKLKNQGFIFETWIHADAKIYTDHIIGEGSLIFPMSIIEPKAIIGKNTVIWSGAIIGHHTVINDHCWLAANVVVAGYSTVKNNCFIGINSTISNGITIDEFNFIGASSFISKDTKKNSVYICKNTEKFRFDSKEYFDLKKE
jgi:sugar O-acyltransferase (sialic acid O-acetyltransferase NeuD family)